MRKHLFVAVAGLALALALVPGVAGAREIKTTLAEDWPDRVVEIPDSWTITDEQVAEWEAYASEETFSPEAKACYAVEGKSWILHRLYNPYTSEHLYTTDDNEAELLEGIGWSNEDNAMNGVYTSVQEPDPSYMHPAVYRLFNPYTDDHHYTSDKDEYDQLDEIGWVGEGIVFYSGNLYGVPVYRLYNPYATRAYHHFTQDKDEVEALVEAGWVNEGVAWFYTNQKGA